MSKLDDLNPFLDDFLNKVIKLGLDVSNYNMDHVAYQASSSEDYEATVKELRVNGELIHEPIIGGRRVAMIKLTEPIKYKGNNILALEIIEQKEDQICGSGWEHAEFVINESYETFMAKYPDLPLDTSSMGRPVWSHLKLKLADNMQLKFHKMDILKTINLEEKINAS